MHSLHGVAGWLSEWNVGIEQHSGVGFKRYDLLRVPQVFAGTTDADPPDFGCAG